MALLLAMLAAAASGFRLPTTFTFSSGRSRWAAARARGPSRLTMLARTPARPPQRPHTKVPVTKPGQYDISALRTNQQLAGKVMGVYDGQ